MTFIGLLAVPLSVYAQFPKQCVSASYFGELIKHPGLSFDYRYNIAPDKPSGLTLRHHLFTAGTNLSFYAHRKSHIGVSLSPQFGYQHLSKGGFALRLNVGIGLLRQFNTQPTYYVNNKNEVAKISMAGRNKLMTSLSLGIGQNLLKRKNIPWGWHFDLGMFTESPTNTGFIPHLFIKTGVDYFFNFKKNNDE